MTRLKFIFLSLGVVVVSLASLFFGSVDIPAGEVFDMITGSKPSDTPFGFILFESRLPQMITSLAGGAALAVAGLILQTLFRNPLAGPSILGVSSGAGLGVAVVMLGVGGISASVARQGLALSGAFAGSFAVMGLLLLLALSVKNDMILLIAGIMISYLASSVTTLLSYISDATELQGFVIWGMGSFNNIPQGQLPLFVAICVVGLLAAMLMIKQLDIIQLGDHYAANLGISVNRFRICALTVTGVLTAAVTAYCGPVSFIGLAVPHIARLLFRSSGHKVLLPATAFCGALIGVSCNVVCTLPESMALPLNSVTPLFGVPVILYILLRPVRRWKR